MKISYNWLQQYIDVKLAPEKIAQILTDCGLEVEAIEHYESVKGGLKGFVVGEVKTKEKHPNADKLSLTKVDIGQDKLLNIVCGAPNVDVGQKVVVATIGTIIYTKDGQFEIKSSKIRGELSEGMICAEDELGIGEGHDGILVLPNDVKIGTLAKDYFNVYNDVVFEIGLTPNRVDAASHVGVARDIVAVLNQHTQTAKLLKPEIKDLKPDNQDLNITVKIESDACQRYSGVALTDVKIQPSPLWLQNSLKAIGLKPINNVVDATNYVLHELGHPLHAFDADKIKGRTIRIKHLSEETNFTTLDGQQHKLTTNDLMICDTDSPLCIAGVFGGQESGITANTKNIFLESAYFSPTSVRKTSKHHAIKTDSSFRFERGADPNITLLALKRAALLIKEIADAKISSDIIDVYPQPIPARKIVLTYPYLYQMAGKTIEKNIVKNILQNLEIEIINETSEALTLLSPTFKPDVTRSIDVVEEILRIYGYNNIEAPQYLNTAITYAEKNDKNTVQNIITNYLVNNGFYETMNNSLTNASYYENSSLFPKETIVTILNPLSSELNILRQSLIFGGLETLAFNQNRQANNLKIFEFGKVYKQIQPTKYEEETHLCLWLTGNQTEENWQQPDKEIDFYFAKSFAQNICKLLHVDVKNFDLQEFEDEYFAYGLKISSNRQTLFKVGELAQSLIKQFDIHKAVFYVEFNFDQLFSLKNVEKVKFKELPKFPFVRRDLALLVDRSVKFNDILKVSSKVNQQLIKQINLFDVYEGNKLPEGKKSYAVSYILQDENKTLTDKDIDTAMQKIIKTLEKELNAELRK